MAYDYSVIICFLLQLTQWPSPVHCHYFYFHCLHICYHESRSVWRQNTRWAHKFVYIIYLYSSFPSRFLFAEGWLEAPFGHRDVVKAILGQLPLFLAKSKTSRRTIPLVLSLGKLFYCCITLLVNKFSWSPKWIFQAASWGCCLLLYHLPVPAGIWFCHLRNSHSSCSGQLLDHHLAAALPD